MRLPVLVTKTHRGKAFELDMERETITLLGIVGERLGTVPWASVIEMILGASGQPKATDSRSEQRASLILKVRYTTPDGKVIESRASGIGGGGLFIESAAPLRVGTHVPVAFALPDQPTEWLEAQCTVSWVCPKPDQYTFFPGMGMRFTDISPDIRSRLRDLVAAMTRPGGGKP